MLLKYKFVMIVVAAGILLMILPSTGVKRTESEKPSSQSEDTNDEIRLCNIISQINGVGRVHVMLTQISGKQIIYQTDEDSSGDRIQKETILITDSERNQTGLISQVRPPVYLGAVVVCQGANDAAVKLAVVDAVSKATGLGSDKISVLEMK